MKWTLRSALLICTLGGFLDSALSQTPGYTGLSGFYDYQTNYRTNQYIRMCPNSQMIHAIMMVALDSLNVSVTRRTAYAFSSNRGATWNTFNHLMVPDRRSGFPTLDIGQGQFSTTPIIASHSTIGGILQSSIYLDYPAGEGAFTEITPPPPLGGDEPGFPEVAGVANGSVTMFASRFAAGTLHATGTPDFIGWSPWRTITSDFVSDGFVTEADTTGRVGVVIGTPENALLWLESTDNGITWPASPTPLLPEVIVSGSDTFVVQQGIDFVELASGPVVTFGVTKLVGGLPTQRHQGIGFWSGHTGFVLAVPHSSIPGAIDTLLKRQVNQNTVGYPAIGLSGSTIVIAFQAYMQDTSASGFNYGDVFLTLSTNGGATWTTPVNVSHSQFMDDRYPSMSKWNPPMEANFVWQEDTQPGSSAFGDGSPISRSRQVFFKHPLTPIYANEVQTMPTCFVLHQNYPNPFNPTTAITFQIPNTSLVTLKVFDVLGREMATLVNERKEPGNHTVTFDAGQIAGGVYICRITSDTWTESRKMLLLK